MNQPGIANPHLVLREAIGGNRLIGVVMIGIGLVFCVPAMLEPLGMSNFKLYLLATSGGIFTLGPGILYQIAAYGMNHRQQQAGEMSKQVAKWQSIVSLAAIPIAVIFGFVEPNVPPIPIIPLIANVFFVPAVLVQAWKISSAIRRFDFCRQPGMHLKQYR